MPTRKTPEPQSQAPPEPQPARKSWKKKSPVEVFLDQEQRLKDEVAKIEAELEDKRAQLEKFEQARKIFETS